MYDLIISMASFKDRLINNSPLYAFSDIISIKDIKIHFVLNIFKKDEQYITNEFKNFIQQHNIEVIKFPLNIRSHLKYFNVMLKYKDLPIITIDDDIKYNSKDIIYLYKYYIENNSCVISNLCRKIHKNIPYKWWPYINKRRLDKHNLAIGCGGVLYPPNCLKIKFEDLNEFIFSYELIRCDDLYLKYRELVNNISVLNLGQKNNWNSKKIKQKSPQLYIQNVKCYNDMSIKYLNKKFNFYKLF